MDPLSIILVNTIQLANFLTWKFRWIFNIAVEWEIPCLKWFLLLKKNQYPNFLKKNLFNQLVIRHNRDEICLKYEFFRFSFIGFPEDGAVWE